MATLLARFANPVAAALFTAFVIAAFAAASFVAFCGARKL